MGWVALLDTCCKHESALRLNVYDMIHFQQDPQPALVPILSHACGMMEKEWKQLTGDTGRLGILIGSFKCLHLSPKSVTIIIYQHTKP